MARGIVQGGVLSASLFSLVVDRVCAKLQACWEAQGRSAPFNVRSVKQWMLAYVDDSELWSRDVDQLKQLLRDVREELTAIGLEINMDKTKPISAP